MSEQAWQPVSDTVGRPEDYAAMVRKVHAYDALESRAAALQAALEEADGRLVDVLRAFKEMSESAHPINGWPLEWTTVYQRAFRWHEDHKAAVLKVQS